MPLKLVKRHGSPNWYIRGTVRGVLVEESTGISSREAAEALRTKREWEITQGSIFGRRAVANFAEAAGDYMNGGGERRFMTPILHEIGLVLLSDIDQVLIEKTARKLYPDCAPATLNRQVIAPISAVLKHAHTRKLCDYLKIERMKEPRGRVRWLSPEDADRLIACCSPHLRPLVTFLFYTGARMSEALYLDWQDVDLKRAHVQFSETKNGEARGVPLHTRVVAELANLKNRAGAVFRRPDGLPYEVKKDGGGQIKTAFNGACRRAGITDFSPHDCRHTWATWHYAANRDLLALKSLGGWKTEKMVFRYAHVNTSQHAASINSLPWGNSGQPSKDEDKTSAKTGA
jgi:integrase